MDCSQKVFDGNSNFPYLVITQSIQGLRLCDSLSRVRNFRGAAANPENFTCYSRFQVDEVHKLSLLPIYKPCLTLEF